MLLFDYENYDGVGTCTSIVGLLVAIFFSVPVPLIGFIATGCSSFVSSYTFSDSGIEMFILTLP